MREHKEKEKLHKRNKYEILIYGPNIEYYANDVFLRLNELKKCRGIEAPCLIQPGKDEQGKRWWIHIVVDN